MRSKVQGATAETILDKRRMQSLGVLLPIRLEAMSFMPGRHSLGRAGEGMRFLRTRPYEPGEDNPRNIDKFSPAGELWVNDWEAEGQASIRIFGDMSGSMAFEPKAAVRNLALLQLNYSLWRASDRVATLLYSGDGREEFARRNLRTQLLNLAEYLSSGPAEQGQDIFDMLGIYEVSSRKKRDDLIFIISDFAAASAAQDLATAQDWREVLRKLPCDVVPVIITFELDREITGAVKLWDPERRAQRLTLLSTTRIDEINAREKRRVEGLQSLFRSLALDFLTLKSERDVYPQLVQLSRMRRKKKL